MGLWPIRSQLNPPAVNPAEATGPLIPHPTRYCYAFKSNAFYPFIDSRSIENTLVSSRMSKFPLVELIAVVHCASVMSSSKPTVGFFFFFFFLFLNQNMTSDPIMSTIISSHLGERENLFPSSSGSPLTTPNIARWRDGYQRMLGLRPYL